MLKKLLKYDLKSIFKVLIIFYCLATVFSVLTRIFFAFGNSLFMEILRQIFTGATISMVCSILINNLMRMWVRFNSNLYGDESYLSHTLPVTYRQHYTSKALCSLITLITSLVFIVSALFIAYYSKDLLTTIKNLLFPATEFFDVSIVAILVALVLIVFLQIANILQCGFTGLILGHRANVAKTGLSVLFGFIAYSITQMFVVLVIAITALFNDGIKGILTSNAVPVADSLKLLVYLSIGIYSALLVIGYIVNIKLLKKGVNVD